MLPVLLPMLPWMVRVGGVVCSPRIHVLGRGPVRMVRSGAQPTRLVNQAIVWCTNCTWYLRSADLPPTDSTRCCAVRGIVGPSMHAVGGWGWGQWSRLLLRDQNDALVCVCVENLRGIRDTARGQVQCYAASQKHADPGPAWTVTCIPPLVATWLYCG